MLYLRGLLSACCAKLIGGRFAAAPSPGSAARLYVSDPAICFAAPTSGGRFEGRFRLVGSWSRQSWAFLLRWRLLRLSILFLRKHVSLVTGFPVRCGMPSSSRHSCSFFSTSRILRFFGRSLTISCLCNSRLVNRGLCSHRRSLARGWSFRNRRIRN